MKERIENLIDLQKEFIRIIDQLTYEEMACLVDNWGGLLDSLQENHKYISAFFRCLGGIHED